MKKLAVEYYLKKRNEKKQHSAAWQSEIERLDKVYHYLDTRELKAEYKNFLESAYDLSAKERFELQKKINLHIYLYWGTLGVAIVLCLISGIAGIRFGAIPITMLLTILSSVGILLLAYRMTSPEFRVWQCSCYERVLRDEHELIYAYGRVLYEFYGIPKYRPDSQEVENFFQGFEREDSLA